MGDGLNEGVVADTAKLMMHRLIVGCFAATCLVEKAKVAQPLAARNVFGGQSLRRKWGCGHLCRPTG
jgi:hypothetical protein